MTDFGSDISTFPTLDGTMRPITGQRVVLEACARRLQTPRGALWAHQDYGLDLRAWLNESFGAASQAEMAAAITAELEKDERVLEVAVSSSLDARTDVLTVRIGVATAEGAFRLTLAVSRATVDVVLAE